MSKFLIRTQFTPPHSQTFSIKKKVKRLKLYPRNHRFYGRPKFLAAFYQYLETTIKVCSKCGASVKKAIEKGNRLISLNFIIHSLSMHPLLNQYPFPLKGKPKFAYALRSNPSFRQCRLVLFLLYLCQCRLHGIL